MDTRERESDSRFPPDKRDKHERNTNVLTLLLCFSRKAGCTMRLFSGSRSLLLWLLPLLLATDILLVNVETIRYECNSCNTRYDSVSDRVIDHADAD
jgi:hypothetical protein